MMNGMNFGMDGPAVTGWWYNPSTGDRFNAVDTYFEDNNLLIKTSEGRLLNYNQIQNYVHVEKPDMIPDKPVSKPSTTEDDIPAEVLAEIDNGEDNGGLLIPDDNIYGIGEPERPAIKDFDIIDRALSGKDMPEPVANIFWKNFPKREIEMLVDVMNISEDDIIQYYINKISIDAVRALVAMSIDVYITSSMNDNKSDGESSVTATSGVSAVVTEVKKKTTTKKK